MSRYEDKSFKEELRFSHRTNNYIVAKIDGAEQRTKKWWGGERARERLEIGGDGNKRLDLFGGLGVGSGRERKEEGVWSEVVLGLVGGADPEEPEMPFLFLHPFLLLLLEGIVDNHDWLICQFKLIP